jgi:oligoribonuclease NrnB/cAMP/cGMP phosphodiesterase (DHH superfamily)
LKVGNIQPILDNQHKFSKVTLLDHHISDRGVFEILKDCSFTFENRTDLTKSATLISHEYCLKEFDCSNINNVAIHEMVTLVNSYDIYDREDIEVFRRGKVINNIFSTFKDPIVNYLGLQESADSGIINVILQSVLDLLAQKLYTSAYLANYNEIYLKLYRFENCIVNSVMEGLNEFLGNTDLSQGELIATIMSTSYCSNLNNFSKYNSKLCVVDGLRVVFSANPLNREMVYDILYNKFDVDIFIMYNAKRKAFELRGCSDTVIPSRISLAVLAKEFGGGGHPAAAGFPQFNEFSPNVLKDENLFTLEVCNPIISKILLLANPPAV